MLYYVLYFQMFNYCKILFLECPKLIYWYSFHRKLSGSMKDNSILKYRKVNCFYLNIERFKLMFLNFFMDAHLYFRWKKHRVFCTSLSQPLPSCPSSLPSLYQSLNTITKMISWHYCNWWSMIKMKICENKIKK